jgi:hypothetical protein
MIHKRTLSNFSPLFGILWAVVCLFGLSLAYHRQQDLAKFGYKPSVKVKEINNSYFISTIARTCH